VIADGNSVRSPLIAHCSSLTVTLDTLPC